ncbi:hypothetical protein Tco_1238561 [Tanacetum coccineum]
MLQDVKSYLGRSFAMKDLGDAAYILGIKIYRDSALRKLNCGKSQGCFKRLLRKQRMQNIRPTLLAIGFLYAEYIAAFDASKEAVWIRKFISGLGIVPTIEEPISMYCDNTGAIAIAKDDGVTKGEAGVARSGVAFFVGVADVDVSGGLYVVAKVGVTGTDASVRDLLRSNAISARVQSVDTNMLSN